MINFVGGPLDGKTDIRDVEDDAYLLREAGRDAAGWYTLHHDVAELRISSRSDLVLSKDDLIAQWHERNAPTNFQVGDEVVIPASDVVGTIAVGPFDGNAESPGRHWMVQVTGGSMPTACGEADMLLYRRP